MSARRVAPLTVALAVLALVLASCGSSTGTGNAAGGTTLAPAAATTVPAAEPVVKDVLAEDVDPPGAPGYTLTLIRYTIAPGAKLAPHVHPGVQMAHIDQGTLSYTIVSGTAQVRRGTGPAEPVTGPAHLSLGPGDSVVEPYDMVHFGANDTTRPVVITATLLTETDKGLSVAATTGTTVP